MMERKEQLKQATDPALGARERLLIAAEYLMDGRPMDDISVEEICDTAKISQGSMYHFFPKKEMLIRELNERFLNFQRTYLVERQASYDWQSMGLEETVHTILSGYIDFHFEFENWTASIRQSRMRRHELRERVLATDRFGLSVVIELVNSAARREGLALPVLESEVLVFTVYSAIMQAFVDGERSTAAVPGVRRSQLAELLSRIALAAIRGLGRPINKD